MSLFRSVFIVSLVVQIVPAVQAADIAVILSANIEAYQDALRGFKQTVDHDVTAEYDMRGDLDRGRRIVTKLKKDGQPDLVLAVGIWALQAIVEQALDHPVVFAMVLNPTNILDRTAKKITGASMNISVDRSIHLFKRVNPRMSRIGVAFNPAKTGYLVRQATSVAQDKGVQLVTREIGSSKEAIRAVNSLYQEDIDALWVLPDETVLDPKVIEYALLASYRNKIPLLGLSDRQAQMGALLSLSFASSEDIGRQSGELANAVLGGDSPEEIPYTTARKVKLTLNLKAANKLGVEIPESVLASADAVIR